MFGEYIKELRLEAGLTLREFCRRMDEDASNWSKIERGKLAPPQDEEKLAKIITVLGVDDTEKQQTLKDYASIDAGKIPDYIMSDEDVMNALPVFFRTVGSVKPSEEDLKELIKRVREGL